MYFNVLLCFMAIASSLFLSVLAGDLLYLYQAGAWTDPNRIILVAELAFLIAFAVGGLSFASFLLWLVKKKVRGGGV